MCEQAGGEVRVRAYAEVHLHPHSQVRHQVGKDLLLSPQVPNALREGNTYLNLFILFLNLCVA